MKEEEFKVKKERLKEIIMKEAFVRNGEESKVVTTDGTEGSWLFDFRPVFLETNTINLIVDIFWHYFEKDIPFQIGGQEIAAIPFISAIVTRGFNGKPMSGFMIRKSRKWVGLQKMIEGALTDEKIILVDDVINSATNAKKQISIIEDAGKKVYALFTVIKYRDESYYNFLKEKNIRLISIFDLSELGLHLSAGSDPLPNKFKVIWRYQNPHPSYFHRVPKSAPVIDGENVYFGTDNEEFIALNQTTGLPAWKFKVGKNANGKSIFSTPALFDDRVYFGSYDGNFYCLNKNTGKLRWKFEDADWVGSSPAIAKNLGMVFIGLEFGLINKRGGIAALDLGTGKKIWDFSMPDYVHSSPAYCEEKKVVVVGSNNNCAYLFDGKTGKLKWTFENQGAIKGSFGFDVKTNLVIFGTFDHNIYAINMDSGKQKGIFKTGYTIFSSPLVRDGNVYVSSTDKCLYSFNLQTGEMNWEVRVGGRILADPVIIDDKIYIGATDGRLYEIRMSDGEITDFFQTTERITNKIAYNPKTKRIFLPTYANEIYCLGKL